MKNLFVFILIAGVMVCAGGRISFADDNTEPLSPSAANPGHNPEQPVAPYPQHHK